MYRCKALAVLAENYQLKFDDNTGDFLSQHTPGLRHDMDAFIALLQKNNFKVSFTDRKYAATRHIKEAYAIYTQAGIEAGHVYQAVSMFHLVAYESEVKVYPNVERNALLNTLGLGQKIPADLHWNCTDIICYDWDNAYHAMRNEPCESFASLDIRIDKSMKSPTSHKSSKHRIFCACPNCGKFVPVGRLRQHTQGEVRRHKAEHQLYRTDLTAAEIEAGEVC